MLQRSLRPMVEHGFRPDIEGLRALAVIAVVAFHAGVPGLTGGFVGVDVFFVVSGYLITRLVLGELAATGTISLRGFWARRARRLLPAACLTVVVTVVLAQRMLPPLAWRDLAVDVFAVATFSANFVFAHRFGDYFGAQLGSSQPSPLLHFWSLSLEEQFYLCWPPLLVLLTRRPRQYRRLLLATIAVLATAGFLVGVALSASRPSWAFFLLPARMGELLVGAGLAVLGSGVAAVPARWRAVGGWAGVAGIALACVWLDETTPWPGLAVALPVLATAAVICAGPAGDPAWAPAGVLGVPWLQWVGRHSYAIYLWHWPALVLAEAEWGPLDGPQRALAVAVAVGASALSVRLVEDPVRRSRPLALAPGRSLVLGGALCAIMVGAGWDLRSSMGPLDGGVDALAPVLDPLDPVASAALAPGPAGAGFAGTATSTTVAAGSVPTTAAAPASTVALTPTTSVPPTATTAVPPAAPTTWAVAGPSTGRLGQLVAATQRTLGQAEGAGPVPSNLAPPLAGARDRSQPYDDGCVNIGANHQLQPCEYGVAGAGPTILLYGDSHAAQWFEPIERFALDRGFRLVVLLKGGCPVAAVDVPTPVLRYTCPPYRDRVVAWIERNDPDLVVVANSYTQYPADAQEWAAGTDETVGRLAEVARRVLLIGDNPASVEDPPACLSAHLDDASACATSRDDAVRPDRISAEVVAARDHDVAFVDTSDWFCTADTCPAVVGNVLVMRDETHITAPMAMFLQPLVAAALDAALAGNG